MANLNQVFLIGRLTRDPELRYIPSGKAVANLSLATSSVFTTQEGERKEETCFVRIVVWGKQAENCSQYLGKGSQIFAEGRLQSRSWETEDGVKRNTLEVVARRIQFLDKIESGKPTEEDEGSFREEEEKIE
jgi:single-strand DNA-binding protein